MALYTNVSHGLFSTVLAATRCHSGESPGGHKDSQDATPLECRAELYGATCMVVGKNNSPAPAQVGISQTSIRVTIHHEVNVIAMP
jgi:hypothetical protein